jgi:hypothetical protein
MVRYESKFKFVVNINVVWYVTSCSMIDAYRRFGETCCLLLQVRSVGRAGVNAADRL